MSRQSQNIVVGGLAFVVAALAMVLVAIGFSGNDDETAATDLSGGGAIEAGTSMLTVAPPSMVDSSLDIDGAGRGGMAAPDPLAPVATPPTTAAPATKAPTTPAPTTAAPTSQASTTTTEAKAGSSAPSPSDGPESTVESDEGNTKSTPATDPPKTEATDQSATTLAPVEPDPTTSTTEATTTVTTSPSAPTNGLTAVEQEIIRLTNQLRANPGGPLKRQKPMPTCVDESFYGIQIDSSTNHPKAVPTLKVDEAVSIRMARDWSFEMSQANKMYHRPGDSAKAKYVELGINYRAYGENVAWGSGYAESAIARVFFEGWRESDTGHYCSMVAPVFTHFGVGHYRNGRLDWSTQNFYTPG